MKFCTFKNLLVGAALASLTLAGCGSSGNSNVVTVAVSPSAGTVIATQPVNLTAVVSGATNTSVTWTCTFTTTTTTTSATGVVTSTTAPKMPCTAATGILTNIIGTGTTTSNPTATYTAPTTIPDPSPTITITATSVQDPKKFGTAVFSLDSGIRLAITPPTATVATGESTQFVATLANANNGDVTWLLTQDTTISPTATACPAATCGTITEPNTMTNAPGGLYTAPATVPTIPTVTLVATSNADKTRFVFGTITIVKAANVAFTGVSPTLAPLGGIQQDVFLAAPNITSNATITINGAAVNNAAQLKVVFAAGGTTSIGARLRLTSQNLAAPGPLSIAVGTNNSGITSTGGPFIVTVIPTRPSVVNVFPNDLPQGTTNQSVLIDGGYFGPVSSQSPNAASVRALLSTPFNGGSSLQAINLDPSSTPRRLVGSIPSLVAPNPVDTFAGLFPIVVQSVSNSSESASSNIAVIPDYLSTNPASIASTIPLAAASNPSAIAIDNTIGVAAITNASTGTVQFLSTTSPTPALIGSPIAVPSLHGGPSVPTGVAVDNQLHLAAVVNYADRSLSVFALPQGGNPASFKFSIDLANLIPTSPSPFPYSVGIDPYSHYALIAFASTNVGFVADINSQDPAAPACLLGAATHPCVFSSVTLETGATPQIAFEPRVHLAYVTPGGAGNLSVVDLTQKANQVNITSATRANDIVTVTTATAHGLNAGNPGTVLISGLPNGTAGTNFNGTFAVNSVIDANNFTYSQNAVNDTATSTAAAQGTVLFGNPFLTYSISPTIQGIAINTETRSAALADPIASVAQVTLINSLDESVRSISLFAGVTGATFTGAPELGATNVAFQPFTNTLVSVNTVRNEISLVDPTSQERLQIIPNTGQTGQATITVGGAPLILNGAVAVDPASNLAFVVNSGSNSISVLKLGSIKAAHISSVSVPPNDMVAGELLPQATFISPGGAAQPLSGVTIFGAGFVAGSQVRLDGVAIPGTSVVSNRQINVTIPVSNGPMPILTGPRRFALDVVSPSGLVSNVTDFTVIEAVPAGTCTAGNAAPNAVAVDEQHGLAIVTNSICNTASAISLNSTNVGAIVATYKTGSGPAGVAVIPRLSLNGTTTQTGVAVVTNNTAGTVSILDLSPAGQQGGLQVVTDVTVGTNPSGVAIDQETGLAIVANTGSNTVSALDLTPLSATPLGKVVGNPVGVDQTPIAVAIDPDRGTNNRGLAVVTGLILNGASPPSGALDAVDIGATIPVKSVTGTVVGIQTTPTGIVVDQAANPVLFYTSASDANLISTFNPDTGAVGQIKVGINPTGLAYNLQNGLLLTVNSLSNTVSLVDSQTFQTTTTLPLGGTGQFSAAIDTLTNLAVITDSKNNRVLLFPLP